MPISNALASVAVKNLEAAIPWYERLIGRPATSRPMAEVAEWKFDGGGWLQVYENPPRAGHGSVTLAVSDIEEQRASLADEGIDAGSAIDSPQARVVMIKDPDGNSIAFAQALDVTMAC